MPDKKKNLSGFTHLGDILSEVVAGYRRRPEGRLSIIWEIWDGAVGETIAENARPAAFKGDLLLVHVSSSVWLQQLRFIKQEIMKKVNTALGNESVREIKFKIGPL